MKEIVGITRNTEGSKRDIMGMQKLRLTINETCHFLSVKRDKLNKLCKDDPSFPRPIKEGVSRQAAVYFDHSELLDWWEEKKKTRYS